MEAVHRVHHRRPDPQTPHHRSRVAPDSVRDPRTPAMLLGTEGRRRWLLQPRRSSALGFTRHLPPRRPRSSTPLQPGRDAVYSAHPLATPSRRVLTPEQVQQILQVLPVREQLIVRLALFSGMRPGEIFALQRKHIAEDHVEVVHRIYRGKLDRPKSERSKRTVALSSTTQNLMTQWRQQSGSCDPDAWVFPSAKLTTPLGRDNAWRGLLAPRLKTIQLQWATFRDARMPVFLVRPVSIRSWSPISSATDWV